MMRPRTEHASNPTRRRGALTVAVLVCLVLISIIAAGLLRQIRTQRLLIRAEENHVQADWLAESGLNRAVARIEADRSYTGETWSLTPADLGGTQPGVVTIRVEPAGTAAARRVLVQADYPSDPLHRVRSRKESIVSLGSGPEETTP